ncbi:serine protease [Altererythrobacter sp. KTW20L]|uniref:S1 family peptidase n=1 Tax=Altererythrobacter sp. KTW20L TaxID=2942210 RepID=UPI0020C0F277|nr:serine protease [Altererythrobacter sp. KTW20L]MCL6249520.1 serine protease [Altererythrobacter sp. KTW20L]
MTLRSILAPAFLLLAALAGSPAHADPADIEAAARGVVRVIVADRNGQELFPISHGSGFAVNAETIVTNAHVVGQAVDDPSLVIGIVPSEGAEAVYGRVISVSPRNDLALIRTTSPLRLPPLTLAGIAPSGAGAVTSIGYPQNVDQAQGLGMDDIFRAHPPVTSMGFLSGRRPSRDFDTLLHTAPIARGNSGGPLVDDCGRVIGVNSFGTDSARTEAEFFFAVSIRELLPFLRANNITPRVNSLPCRSLAEMEEAEREFEQRRQMVAREQAEADEQAAAQRRAALSREIEFAVLDERTNGMALALVLLMFVAGGGAFAFDAHRKGQFRHRAIGGSITLGALALAAFAWLSRPAFTDIEDRLEDRLRSEMAGEDGGPIEVATPAGSFRCVLDTARSRVLSEPVEVLPLEWSADGCVNGQTQFGMASGQWTRVLVSADEQSVALNRFDPATGEYVVDRFLLDREAMVAARTARAAFQAPACGAGPEAAAELGVQQLAVTTALPQSPNERLVYTCGDGATGVLPPQQ